jgi:sporulation protein YpjB
LKAKIAVFIFLIYLLKPFSIYAEQPSSSMDKLDMLSDEALQMVKIQKYEEAKKILDYFSDQFLSGNVQARPFNMDELRIVSNAHDDAVEAAASIDMNHNERMNRVTSFRLVIDAITSNRQPLWTEMEDPIMDVFGGMKEAAYTGDSEAFHSSLNTFLTLYGVIYPALKVDVEADRLQQLDTRVNFIDHYRPQVVSETSSQQELDALEADLSSLFDEMTDDEADPSLWWVIISTGSIIILTLSYVGWRKYKGDQDKEKGRKRELKN